MSDAAPTARPAQGRHGADVASRSGAPAGDIVGYRAFLAIVVTAYATIIALTPPLAWETDPVPWPLFAALSLVYLGLGIWGFALARRHRRLPLSLAYLTIEFAVGMWINSLAWGNMLPLILLPLAAQAVTLLPRPWAAAACVAVIAGVSGNLAWVPAWPAWLRNTASATAAVVFVVVYVGVAERERAARERAERLAADVAALAAASERTRMTREIHDTLGHYLTVIHVQLEAARAVLATDPDRGRLAIRRAQALAKDGLTAVRQSVRALREDAHVDGVAAQLASIVASVSDERFDATFTTSGTPRPVSAQVALALQRTALEALTNVRRHAAASRVDIALTFRDAGTVHLKVQDDGRGAPGDESGGFGLIGIRERAEQLRGTARHRSTAGHGFTLELELPG
jgi:signal transduction histidine kinase